MTSGKHQMNLFELFEADTLQPPSIDVGDTVLVGKFKNRKAKVTGFKKDDNNQPSNDKGDLLNKKDAEVAWKKITGTNLTESSYGGESHYVFHGTTKERWEKNKVGTTTLYVSPDQTVAYSYANDYRTGSDTPILVKFNVSDLAKNNTIRMVEGSNGEAYEVTGDIEKIKPLGNIVSIRQRKSLNRN